MLHASNIFRYRLLGPLTSHLTPYSKTLPHTVLRAGEEKKQYMVIQTFKINFHSSVPQPSPQGDSPSSISSPPIKSTKMSIFPHVQTYILT